jgi:predicted MFS family arabinose efflux permease
MAVVERRFPEWLRHAQAPGARTFAILGGIEAAARAILASVLPLTAYRAAGDAAAMSRIYLLVGLVSLAAAMIIPALGRIFRRRYLYTAGGLGLALAALLAGLFEGRFVLPALFVQAIGTVTLTICFNAYLMDYIQWTELGASESLRLFYSAAAWTVGPFLGVWLMEEVHYVAPFALSLLAALALILAFWWFRLGDGKAITRAVGPAPSPLAYLGRFARRPRLVAGWLFASVRSCGWVAFYLYVPVFAVESGLGDKVGGFLVSFGSVYLFVTPLMLAWLRRHSVRNAVMAGFAWAAVSFAATAVLLPANAWMAALLLEAAAFFMIFLDLVAGLPFLMAVKPSERTEMSAVYSTFRDVSHVATPAIGALVLLYFPLGGAFLLLGAMFGMTSALASRLPAELGRKRHRPQPAVGDALAPAGPPALSLSLHAGKVEPTLPE